MIRLSGVVGDAQVQRRCLTPDTGYSSSLSPREGSAAEARYWWVVFTPQDWATYREWVLLALRSEDFVMGPQTEYDVNFSKQMPGDTYLLRVRKEFGDGGSRIVVTFTARPS